MMNPKTWLYVCNLKTTIGIRLQVECCTMYAGRNEKED